MTKARHDGRRKASVLAKARAGRSAHVVKRETLAVVKNLRLMDDTFMSKCLENAPKCSNAAEMYFDILKRQVSQFKNSEEGRHAMCEAVEEFAEKIAVRREARGKREGRREGRREGEALGKRLGKREGRREAVLALAKKLLANGKLMLKEIAECTGLSLAQVKKLQPTVA